MTEPDRFRSLPVRQVIGFVAFVGLMVFVLKNEFHVTEPFAQSYALMNSLSTMNIMELPVDDRQTLPAFQSHKCQKKDCASNFTESCLARGCIEQVASGMARAYPEWKNHSWCATPASKGYNRALNRWQGIILTKVPKAASTTSAGVALRLSRRHGMCPVQHHHFPGTRYQNRTSNTSFLFTSVRDPAKRAISAIFYKPVSQNANDPTDAFVMEWLNISEHELHGTISKEYAGFQTRYASLQLWNGTDAWSSTNPTSLENAGRVQAQVRQILDDYDFILVVERMEESLVAMSILLGVHVGDVLVTSSKLSGAYTIILRKNRGRKCKKIRKSFVSPAVKAYLESDEWRAKNYGDYLFHAAANYCLDATIDKIGRERFDRELAEYRRLRALEQELCAPFVDFPCSKDGEPQVHLTRGTCYIDDDDVGCGYKCIDELIRNHTTPVRTATNTEVAKTTARLVTFA